MSLRRQSVLVDTRSQSRIVSALRTSNNTNDALTALQQKEPVVAGLEDGEASDFAASILPAVHGLWKPVMGDRPVREVPAERPVHNQHKRPRFRAATRVSCRRQVCSGSLWGLPGGQEVFAEDNIERILHGEVRIQPQNESVQDDFLAKMWFALPRSRRPANLSGRTAG